MKKNRLRELLREGKPSLGTHMISTSPVILEVTCLSGAFDYVELCGEYAAWDLSQLEHFARTIELFPNMSSMMKIEQEPRTFITTRALDAGIQNVLFADCHSAEEVKEAIRTVLPETPQDGGLHGCSMRRSSGYLLECGNEAWAQAQRDAVIAVMIEKASAMEQLDDILEIKGVDMVQFGPCDYAITLGKPGKSRDTDVMNAQKEMIEKALKKGVQPRVEINSYEQASEYLEMGVRHFCLGADVVIQHTFCKQQGGEMRKLLER